MWRRSCGPSPNACRRGRQIGFDEPAPGGGSRRRPATIIGVSTIELRLRSIRTLAWLGDAEFEREVRVRISLRGDFPTRRLDRARTAITCAESQAAMLTEINERLTVEERAVVRRARNLRSQTRVRRDVATYRAATALEALVAYWCLAGMTGVKRFHTILGGPIERAIDTAIVIVPPRRG